MQSYLRSGLVLLALVPAIAVATTSSEATDIQADVEAMLLPRLRANITREDFVAGALRPLRENDRDGDGLDRSDLVRGKSQRDAALKASRAGQLLREDFNGDLTVTREEIETFGTGDRAARIRRADQVMQEYDANADGSATLQEAMTLTRESGLLPLEEMMVADLNADGRVTAGELSSVAERTFDRFDNDGDQLLSSDEYSRVSTRQQSLAEARRLRDAGCAFPKPTLRAHIAAFGAYEGDAISSAYVGSPDDETSLIDVTIERGREPLYLLFTSYEPVIWRLSGDIGRIERVVAAADTRLETDVRSNGPERSSVGIVGVPSAKVTITSRTCLPDLRPVQNGNEGRNREVAIGAIVSLLGREPASLSGDYSPVGVALPAGGSLPAAPGANARPDGFDAAVWEEAARFWRGGLVKIDPAAVVAAEPVVSYSVLPSQMGLAQLVGSGAARKLEGSRFLILRDIARIPPRMAGAHSATLVLAEGVRRPPGDPSHGCVVTWEQAAAATSRNLCRP